MIMAKEMPEVMSVQLFDDAWYLSFSDSKTMFSREIAISAPFFRFRLNTSIPFPRDRVYR